MREDRWDEASEARLTTLEAVAQRGRPLDSADQGALAAFEVFGPPAVRARVEAVRRLTAKPTTGGKREPPQPSAKPLDELVEAALAEIRRGRDA